MAIIIQTGDIVASSNVKKGSKYKYFDRSDSFKKIDTYCYDGEFVIVPSEGNLSVQYVNGKFSHHSKTYRISSSSNNIKYIQYYLLKNLNRLVANGSTVQRVNSDQWKELLLSINVTKKEQQEIIDIIAPVEDLFLKYSSLVRIDTVDNCKKDISDLIDIIEPLEKINNTYKKIISTIEKVESVLLHYSKSTDYKLTFIKGGLPDSDDGTTPFLNVAAANNNPNRYVSNPPNVFLGDVTLTLDGNCGLVNNALEGYNGYLYKVVSDDVNPWQVYYSLLTKMSQQVIKLNETGTTIKHATRAKKELKVFSFEYSDYLEQLFDIRIKLKLLSDNIKCLQNNTIKLLIK